jgi:predicted RNA methylase
MEAAPPDANSTIACISAFSGYRLKETPIRIRQTLANHIIERGDELGTYATSPSLADFLVEIADVQHDDRVLDPACGVGKIVRSASAQCGESVGIEKHNSVATKAVAINHLVEVDAEIRSADALSAIENGEAEARSFDHVITVPPFGLRLSEKYEAPDGFTASVVEEAISRESFEYLKPGGKFTALLPTGVFYRRTAEDLRRFLFENNTVTRIIEVGSGLLAPYSSVPVVILQVQAEQPPERYPIESAVVEAESISSEEIRRTLQEETRTIFSDDFEDSYLPSEVFKSNEAISDLEQSFDSLIQLDSIAQVSSGEKVEERQLTFDEGVPFLKIGDVEKNSQTENKGVPKAAVSDRKTTSDGDILISTHGTVGKVVVPSEPVIPSSNWAVARFEHPDVALVYAAFLSTPQGGEQIQAQAVGSIINYVPLSKLRSILIPDFSHSEISRCADELRALDIDWTSPVPEDAIRDIQDIFAQLGGSQ